MLLLLHHLLLLGKHLTFATPLSDHKEVVFQLPNNADDINHHHLNDSDSFARYQDKTLFYNLNDTQYFTPYEYPSHTFTFTPAAKFDDIFHPVMVVSISEPAEGIYTAQHLKPLIESYFEEDDVIHDKFFENVILRSEDYVINYHLDFSTMVHLLKEYHTRNLIIDERLLVNLAGPGSGIRAAPIHSIAPSSLSQISTGPFLMKFRENNDELDLYPIYRLYPDYYKTFVNGIYPINDGQGTYKTVDRLDSHGNLLIPVPSKLYSRSSGKSLQGERVGVKDLYDIDGIPTAAGSRLYAAWTGNVHETASSVQKLEDEGAVIIGKLKSTALASGGWTIDVTPDQLYPFSPRGDQYQSCGASSSGPACAMAAYDWLDFTIGSDTVGSVRAPAALVGLYGNKPTQNIIPTDGVVPLFNWTDTLGAFTRSPHKLKRVLETWYSDSPVLRKHTSLPSTLLVPSDDFPTMPENIKNMIMNFLQEVEYTLGMKTEMINQTASHPHKHTPNETDHGKFMTADDFDETMYQWQWKVLDRHLVDVFEHINDGRFPPVGSELQYRWQNIRANPFTEEDFDVMRKKLEVTREWLNGQIGKDEETCSKVIYAEPAALNELPSYRESTFNNVSEPLAPIRENPLYPYYQTSISGAPDFTVPIGQVPFKSLVSGKMEMQTVSMSLVAYPGCDLMLLDFIEKLAQAGIIKEVKTGESAF